jgi:hypothetical protein
MTQDRFSGVASIRSAHGSGLIELGVVQVELARCPRASWQLTPQLKQNSGTLFSPIPNALCGQMLQ